MWIGYSFAMVSDGCNNVGSVCGMASVFFPTVGCGACYNVRSICGLDSFAEVDGGFVNVGSVCRWWWLL